MQEPLVSIHMITYNHAPYIAQAIEGVLLQKTDFPFELVIGEDCSTDCTREIVFDYAQKYPEIIRVITSEQNVGMKKNSLRTTQACRGKYIAWCEGDDYWQRDDKLQIQVDYLETHPECGLVCSDYNYLTTTGMQEINNYQRYRYIEKRITESPQIDDILKGVALTCTVMARKNLVIQVINSDPHLHQSEYFKMGDTQLWAEISLASKTHYIDESLATYRSLEESASRSKDTKRALRFLISCSEMFLYLCKKHSLSQSFQDDQLSYLYNNNLRLAFLEMNSDLAEEVKEMKKKFTWKEWLRYYGSKIKLINYGCRAAVSLANLVKKIILPKMIFLLS